MDLIKREYDNMLKKGINYIHAESDYYPVKLKDIIDKPYCLYVKCSEFNMLEMFNKPTVAIIGSRNCSEYGYKTAYNIAKELSTYGITIVSGMAKGIDGAAQKAVIDFGGNTCGVLGCGVDICYPRSNIELYMNIMRKGVLVSEYVPGTKPFPGLFPERNRIISGLSDIVIVVEAGEKSGSLITIDMALEQGRDVFAVPGRLNDVDSIGCNNLIKYGAGIYTDVKDVLEELGIISDKCKQEIIDNNNFLAKEEKIVYSKLGLECKHIDRIVEETNLPACKVMEVLLDFEIRHIVKQIRTNYYVTI